MSQCCIIIPEVLRKGDFCQFRIIRDNECVEFLVSGMGAILRDWCSNCHR